MRQAAANSALRYGSVEPKESNGVNGYGSYKEEQVGGRGGMHRVACCAALCAFRHEPGHIFCAQQYYSGGEAAPRVDLTKLKVAHLAITHSGPCHAWAPAQPL